MTYRLPMRSVMSLATVTVAVAVMLSGCLPQDPEVVPPPEPTTEPVFATDEEALAAATDAYKAYLAMSDLIAQEGGREPERIAPFVTEEWLEQEIEAFKALSDQDRHQVGAVAVTAAELQAQETDSSGVARVGAYFCLDISDTKVATSEGQDVTPASRDGTVTVEVRFGSWTRDPTLIVEGIEPWPASGIC